MTVVRPLSFKEKDTDALVTSASGVMNTALKLPPDMQDAARGVVARWARDLPASLVTVPQNPGIRSDRAVAPIRDAAKQTLVLLKSLVADLKLEGAQAAAARKWPVALVPSPSKAE
jgi:hypothetical protein